MPHRTKSEIRLCNLEALMQNLSEKFVKFEEAFKERGKNHDRNSQAMADFASSSNKMLDQIANLETKNAVYDTFVARFDKLEDYVRGWGKDITVLKSMAIAGFGVAVFFMGFISFVASKLLGWW